MPVAPDGCLSALFRRGGAGGKEPAVRPRSRKMRPWAYPVSGADAAMGLLHCTMDKPRQPSRRGHAPVPLPDQVALVLQGGGALGSFQAGVLDNLAQLSITIDWVAGISIGAVNAAIIAGNPPERRVERLSRFWETVSSGVPAIPLPENDALREAAHLGA